MSSSSAMITSKVLLAGRQTIREFSRRMNDPILNQKLVKFTAGNGKSVELEAVYEDSLSSGSTIGTVVGFHGSPGSHNDFKYIRDKFDQLNVRFIGVNYPGFTFTPEYEGQQHGNEERQSYSNALLDELNIDGKIIYMGHSRGCENALQTAVTRNAHGLVLINPTGLRIHKGVSPMSRLEAINSIYSVLPSFLGNPMMLGIYKAVGFKIKTGEEAINALRSMIKVSLGGQLEHILATNQTDMKKLIVFSGKDHLVEPEIVFESLEKHEGLKHFSFDDSVDQQQVLDSFSEHRGASVFVENDTHFQNKSQAELIAAACKTMFSGSMNKL